MHKERAVLPDVFRIILCIGVVVYHYVWPRPSSGPFMVNGFFVLSGFLIGVMFAGCESLNAADFYSRKLRRLLPLFLVALLVGISYRIWSGTPWPDEYKPGCLGASYLLKHYNTPLWYMLVEGAFLLLVPFLYYLHRLKGGLSMGLLAVFALGAWMFSHVPQNAPFGDDLYYYPPYRCWQFVLGIYAAGLYRQLSQLKPTVQGACKVLTACLFALFVGVGVLLMFVEQKEALNYWNYTFEFDVITCLFFALLIPCLFAFDWQFRNKWTERINKAALLTYPVFLLHVPVFFFLCDVLEQADLYPPKAVNRILATILTLVVSVALMRLERYCMGRFFPITKK